MKKVSENTAKYKYHERAKKELVTREGSSAKVRNHKICLKFSFTPKFVILPNSIGNDPESRLSFSERCLRLVSLPNSVGSTPVCLLLCKRNFSKD